MRIGPEDIKIRKIEKTVVDVEHYISLNADEIAEIIKEKLNDYDSDLYQSTYVADKVIFETNLKGAIIILK